MSIELVSFDLCPFVQRSAIALAHLGVVHDVTYIDLSAKPDWFLAISPRGKVPVLKVDDDVLFESMAILEYLSETVGESRLMPADAIGRARVRAFNSLLGDLYLPLYMLMVTPGEEGSHKQAEKLRAGLRQVEDALGEGPWFFGEQFTLTDCVGAPVTERVRWIEAMDPTAGLLEGLPKLTAWAERLAAHPAVQASTVDDIEQRFASYVGGNWGVNASDQPAAWIARGR